MSFLAPLWIALAGAVAVPLLLHLMRRRLGTRVEFPAARYLARAEREHSRQLRIRNLLLMLLRVLAVLAVALAAARPVTRWLGGGHGPTAIALVLDNSLSTSVVVDGRPLLDDLKAAADELLRQARSDDRLWLVTADGVARPGTAAALRERLAEVGPIAGAGDLRTAVARAAGAVRGAGLAARRVALLTDGQRTAWPEAARLSDVEVLLYQPKAGPPPNRAVLAADARPERWTPRGAVVARVASHDSVAWRIAIGDRTLARGTAAPGGEVVLRAAPPERGWLAGTIELEPDELRADDARHFALWVGATPQLAIAEGAGPFARSAAEVLAGSGRVAIGQGVGVLPADELTAGGLPALVIAPTDPVRAGAADRALARAGIPWRLGPVMRGNATARFVRGSPADSATVLWRHRLRPQAGAVADTLATVGGEPWVVAGPGYVLVASPLVPEASSLPLRAAFVPWLAHVVTTRLVGEPGRRLEAAAGERLPAPTWADALESPAGARTPISGALAAPAAPGVYFLTRGGRRVGALVVNAPASESDLRRLEPRALADRLGARRVHLASDRAGWAALPFRGAPGRSLVPALLALALGVLLIEALAVRGARAA